MSSVKSYFDSHTHVHAYHRPPLTYSQIAEYIKQNFGSRRLNILDLGCGDGSFIKAMHSFGIVGMLLGVDLSYSMIASASLDSKGTSHLTVADGFKLPLKGDAKFDVIHFDCVLHHLVTNSTKGSKQLAQTFFKIVHDRLSEKGIIIVEEVYYNSFMHSELTSKLIFYGLKILNKLRLDFSSFSKNFQPGLEVNFFSEYHLRKLISKHSKEIHRLYRTSLHVPMLYRILFLNEFGRISYGIRR